MTQSEDKGTPIAWREERWTAEVTDQYPDTWISRKSIGAPTTRCLGHLGGQVGADRVPAVARTPDRDRPNVPTIRLDYRHPRFIATVPGKGYRFIPTFSNLGWDGGPVDGEPTTH